MQKLAVSFTAAFPDKLRINKYNQEGISQYWAAYNQYSLTGSRS